VHYRHGSISLGAVVLSALILGGCDETGTNTATTSGSSSSGQGGQGGEGGGGGQGGEGGQGGQGGGTVAISGAPGSAFVNAGDTVKSNNYKLVFTLGQSSPVQSSIKSPSYTLNGGLIGATGNPK